MTRTRVSRLRPSHKSPTRGHRMAVTLKVDPRPARSKSSRRLAPTIPTSRARSKTNRPFELLIATILSAQCTDERVNMVTPELFRR